MNRILCVAILLAAASIAPAAVTYEFTNVTNNSTASASTGGQFHLTVSDYGTNQALFTFNNMGPAASSITDVYFDDGTLLGIASIINTNGVAFSQWANPSNLPGGHTVGFSADFSADSDNPAPKNGINPGESLGIVFDLKNGQDYDDTAAAIERTVNGSWVEGLAKLQVGIHVQAFDNGQSEAFVLKPNQPSPPVVPAPAAIVLAGIGTMAIGMLRRFKSI